MTSSITGNSTGLINTALTNNNTTNDTAAIKEASANTLTDSSPASTPVVSDSVDFSSRAVKIQSISNDFFSGGGLQMADIPQYVQRLQSDGFLTQEQAEKLGVDQAQTETTSAADEAKQQVVNFINDFKQTVGETEGHEALMTLLTKAEVSVASLGEMNSSISKTDFKLVDIELKSYLESDEAQQWSEQDQRSLGQVSTLLSVVNDLNYGTESSAAVNRYAQISAY